MRVGPRIFTLVLAFVTGAGIGFVLTFTHRQYVVDLAGVPLPLGLLGGLAIVATLLLGIRLVFEDRVTALAAAGGVILASALLAIPGNSGSVLLLDDPLGYAWALGPTLVALVVVGWPTRRREVRPS